MVVPTLNDSMSSASAQSQVPIRVPVQLQTSFFLWTPAPLKRGVCKYPVPDRNAKAMYTAVQQLQSSWQSDSFLSRVDSPVLNQGFSGSLDWTFDFEEC